MRHVGSLMILAALLLAADACGQCPNYHYGSGYAYYPAGYYGSSYWPAGYYTRTQYGWHRYGYGYVTGSYCNHYQAPPQLYTPVLVPTYSVGYSPPPVDPKALPQKGGLPPPHLAQAGPGPGYQDLGAQVAAMRAEIAALKAQRDALAKAAPAGAKANALAACARCHTAGSEKGGLAMFDKSGRLALDPEGVAACIDAVQEGTMPKGEKWSDAQRLAANRELMTHLKALAKAPPMPAP